MEEIWKSVIGFENLYEVSNLGNVRSIQFHGKPRIKILSQTSDKKGYRYVKIRDWKNKFEESIAVHRLVAKTFLDNFENKSQVDHIDTNSSNNRVDNLRWITPLENQNNPTTLQRLITSLTTYNKSEAHKLDIQKSQGKPINQYDLNGNFIRTYPSISKAVTIIGTTACCIKRVCDGDRKHHRNYMFKYV